MKLKILVSIMCVGVISLQTNATESPTFPDAFSTRVQSYVVELNIMLNFKLSYNRQRNAAAVEYQERTVIYDFEKNEILTINGVQCEISTVEYSSDLGSELTGIDINADKVDNTKFKIYDALRVLLFDGEQVLSGNENLDETPTEKWTSNKKLLKMDESEISCNTTHWLITNGTKCNDDETPCSTFPMKIEMICSLPETKLTRIIRFYDFSTDVLSEQNFQQPLGVYCWGRQNDQTLPELPLRFRFHGERTIGDVINTGNEMIYQFQYWYDKDLLLFMTEESSNDLAVHTRTYYDHKKKLTYTVDMNMRICSIANDTKGREEFPDSNRMLWYGGEVFKHCQFLGERNLNGIQYVVFVSTNMEEGLSEFELFNHFYLKQTDRFNVTRLIPSFQIMQNINDFNIIKSGIQRISEFQLSPSDWSTIDVTDCFSDEKGRQLIQFELTMKGELVSTHVGQFTEQVHQSLLTTMKISPMRLNRLQVIHFEDGIVTVMGIVLESPAKLGLSKGDEESDMEAAYSNLENEVKLKRFEVLIKTNHSGESEKSYKFGGDSLHRIASGPGTFQKRIQLLNSSRKYKFILPA